MKVSIRNEVQQDFREVEVLTREAFWNLNVPGCDEHYLVHIMRSHRDFIRDLDFVAEYDGRIVGNIMYTRAWLLDENGREKEIVCFGPVSVLPEYQRKGIGSSLISHTTDIARKQGIEAVVILGDPHNYCKHGFKSARDYDISDLDGEYPYGMLALELEKGALGGHSWKFRYSDVYHIDEQDSANFDKNFAFKAKGHRYSQDIFSIAVRSYVR